LAVCLAAGACATPPEQNVNQLNREGVDLMAGGDHLVAQQRFQEAVKLEPENPTTLYNLGNAAFHLQQWTLAETSYRDCLRLDPNHAACQHALALLLVRRNRPKEAWQLVQDWLARQPDSASAHAAYGWLLRESGDLPAAQEQLQKALELDAANVRALIELGQLYEAYAYPERARSLYQRALKHEPNNTEVRDRLASLHARQPTHGAR
jgi:tetratricopeptide (TPR) repeat protein